MPTEKLYFTNPYLQSFSAQVVSAETDPRGFRIILDQTAFYPAAGGQPADQGFLNDVPVQDVIEEGTEIVHITPVMIETGSIVAGALNWARRFDHMQHHTGQHILSQAFFRTYEAETVSFHLSEQTASIDLNIPELSSQALEAVEDLANEIVYANYPVETLNLTPDAASTLAWRTELPSGHDFIRGIRIASFDLCGCGGTHVSSTGEIGMIKILKTSSIRDGTRVYFVCGSRALMDYRRKNDRIIQSIRTLGIREDDLADGVQKTHEELLLLQKENKELIRTLDRLTADSLWEQAQENDSIRIVTHVFPEGSMDRLKEIAAYLTTHAHTYAFLAAAAPKPALVFARSPDLAPSMAMLLKQLLAPLAGRGGGQPQIAQGGSVEAAHLSAILADAATSVHSQNVLT